MQKIDDQIIFSASDLVHFMECRHLSTLDRLNLEVPMQRAPDSEEAELIQNRGYAHEKSYLQQAIQQAGSYIDINSVANTRAEKVAATLQAMEQGIPLIYQATFYQPPMLGYADVLRRVERLALADQAGMDIVTMATAWSKQHDFVASTIVGVTTEEQVPAILAAADLVLPDDLMKAIYKVSREIMYPMG
jgi:uncharacterized protein